MGKQVCILLALFHYLFSFSYISLVERLKALITTEDLKWDPIYFFLADRRPLFKKLTLKIKLNIGTIFFSFWLGCSLILKIFSFFPLTFFAVYLRTFYFVLNTIPMKIHILKYSPLLKNISPHSPSGRSYTVSHVSNFWGLCLCQKYEQLQLRTHPQNRGGGE